MIINSFIQRSSAQMLFLAIGFVTLFAAYPLGIMQFTVWFFAGNAMSILFVNVSDPTQYVWPIQQIAGLFAKASVPRTVQDILIYTSAWFAVSCIAIVSGIIFTLLQLLLNKMLYGKMLQGRKKKWVKITLFLNTGLILSFWGIGFTEFMNSPSISFWGTFGPGLILLVGLVFFVVWWAQHFLNQYVCGIKMVVEPVVTE
ncbi:MAG: hypothetical protein Q8R36_02145 [bacterium]|nr:hypothetical protein [bacterium]